MWFLFREKKNWNHHISFLHYFFKCLFNFDHDFPISSNASLHVQDEEGFNLQKHEPCAFVPWVSVDPYPPAEEVSLAKSKFHGYFNGPKPFTCTVRAGEILYLWVIKHDFLNSCLFYFNMSPLLHVIWVMLVYTPVLVCGSIMSGNLLIRAGERLRSIFVRFGSTSLS